MPLLGVGLAMAVVPLLPVSGLVYFDYAQISLVADHYVYLPMIGGAIALAAVLRAVQGRAALVASCVLVLAWAGLSMRQAMTWRDAQTVGQHTLRVNPHSGGTYNHLGGLALRAGDLAEAEALQLKSIEQKPVNPASLLTLGDIAMRKKDYAAAIEWYGQTARLTPGMPQPWYGLGQAYIAQERAAEAIAAIERGLHHDDAPEPAKEWLEQIKEVVRRRAATQAAQSTRPATAPTTAPSSRAFP
ncbi:MAG: tetratricopeptide repeat protein [Variovorax sp.]|nr:MAG: tetratricopeptide repeat protein [Variovorax sp.]